MVSNISYFHPYLGKIPILTNIFQGGWNHQPDYLWTATVVRDIDDSSSLTTEVEKVEIAEPCDLIDRLLWKKEKRHHPLRSHGTGIFTYIYHNTQPNVVKYTIHGSYGSWYGWWFRNPGFTSWAWENISIIFHETLYIPGGDRRISEPATVSLCRIWAWDLLLEVDFLLYDAS